DAGKKHGLFARLLGKVKHHHDPHELERQVHALEAELKDLADREAKVKGDLDAATTAQTDERDRLVAAEDAGRRADVEGRLAAVAAERERVAADSRDQTPFVFGAGFGVVTPDLAAVERVSAAVRAARDGVEAQLSAARARLEELTRDGADHAR